MTIFKHYTGNALLNNALQTIEILGEVDCVSEITPQLLEKLYVDKHLLEANLCLKSYSMIFTRNGPLHNDAEFGRKIYSGLMREIIRSCETEGDRICEISGLRFHTSFSDIYRKVLVDINYPLNKKKDVSINRAWFPLIGSLGSDAQALPRAKFAVNIHPICLVIMQFLPLSAVLYKGGILLMDCANFQFSKDFIKGNVEDVASRIAITGNGDHVKVSEAEKAKDEHKKYSHYLLIAISIWQNKEYDSEDCVDLNLWSFSNSGAGARTSIDRIPNSLIRKLKKMLSPYLETEVRAILSDPNRGNLFLDCLEKDRDCYVLYPALKYEGVSLRLFEKYHELTGRDRQLKYARYIAGLMFSASYTKEETKLQLKTDAYADVDYKTIVLKELVKAAEQGKWSIDAHLAILEAPDELPVNAYFGGVLKCIHFYLQWYRREKKLPLLDLGDVPKANSVAAHVLGLFTHMINKEEEAKRKKIIKDILTPRENSSVRFDMILVRAKEQLPINRLIPILYNANWDYRMWGVLELLRIYYTQKDATELPYDLEYFKETNEEFEQVEAFCRDYLDYYRNKYGNPETKAFPADKFKKHVLEYFPDSQESFYEWLREMLERVNLFLKESGRKEEWTEDDLLYNKAGDKCVFFVRFAICYELNRVYANY